MTHILISIGSLLLLVNLILVLINQKLNFTHLISNVGKLYLGGCMVFGITLLALFFLNNHDHFHTLKGIIRFDTLSTTMFLMVSIIGFTVLKFSESYLQGDSKYESFITKLLLTINFVQLLMLSGNLFFLVLLWIATSFSLQRLILFYKDRKKAQEAVKKKNVVARISDLFLILSVFLIYFEFETANLEAIFIELKNTTLNQLSLNLELSALFLAMASIIKSVQIPFHGWILGVMEAPTPVSGLLHAGLLNAGPFLIIRFSYLIELSTFTPILLLTIGGMSALYGTLVFPSQPAIKTSLAYSSIGHMGFSLMLCGMGIYSAALLHLIAHSFYKAHSFLSSGSVIDQYRLKMINGTKIFNLNKGQLIASIILTSSTFLSVVYLLNKKHLIQFQLLILSAIIIVGTFSFIIKTTFKNDMKNIVKSIFIIGLLLAAFLFFEKTFETLLRDLVPSVSNPNFTIKGISLVLVLLFTAVVYSSILNKSSTTVSKWQIYKRNGFYIDTKFDHLLNYFFFKSK